MKRLILAMFAVAIGTLHVDAQVITPNPYSGCNSSSTYYRVDLTGTPDSTWISPNLSRQSQCCGVSSNIQCITFEVTLDTGALAIELDMITGAIAYGSEFYFVNCGASTPVGQPVCLSGTGPHVITFCKPGNNANVYQIRSIARPQAPKDDSVRVGCTHTLKGLGYDTASVTWNSIFPGVHGQYNFQLSCSSACLNPVFTPQSGGPAFIDYVITGNAEASYCGFLLPVSDTVRVFVFDSLRTSISPSPATYCNLGPGSGVLLTATATGGDGNYSYTWKNSSGVPIGTGPTYFATSPQTYTVEVNDGLSTGACPGYQNSVSVTVGQIPTVNAGNDTLVCASSPYVYLRGTFQNAGGVFWSTSGTGVYNPGPGFPVTSYQPSAADISAGSVNLYLSSTGVGSGCPNTTDTVIITFSDTVVATLRDTSMLCDGDSLTITPQLAGGTLPYTYLWTNAATSSSLKVGAGTIGVTVTDVVGCVSNIDFANVTSPAALQLIVTKTDESAGGACDGTGTAIVTGGVGPYSYSWAPSGQTTALATGLCYGIHSVTITDANGCQVSGSVVVNTPACLGLAASAGNTNLECYGATGGQGTYAFVNPTGGTPGYNYSWSPGGATTDTIRFLGVGTYTVTVTDQNGCLAVATVSVVQPPPLVVTMTGNNVTTQGGNDGSATANVAGGTPGYFYAWNTGGTTPTINNLIAGVYSVTVFDVSGCSVVDSINILEPPCPNMSLTVNQTNISCNGGSTGAAFAVAQFGTPPYRFLWSTSDSSNAIFGLSAGNYSVQVTDASNCVLFQNFTITEPSPLTIGLAKSDVRCNGAKDGTIDLSVNGGAFPYTFNWNTGSTAEDQIGLSPGTYSVVVTDANGCTRTGVATITEPDVIVVTHQITNVLCYLDSNGSVDATITGGLQPYAYSWSHGSTTEDVVGLPSGIYTQTVTDANGCVVSQLSAVSQPDSLSTVAGVTSSYNGFSISCFGATDGSVGLTSTGGTLPYSYLWSNTATTDTITNGASGLLTVTLTDANGCMDTSSVVLTEPSQLVATGAVTSNYNGAQITCFGQSDGSLNVTATGGIPSYQYLWSNSSTSDSLVGLAAGTYSVVVTDTNGCMDTAFMALTQPDSMYLSGVVTDESCMGDSTGAIDLTVHGGTAAYTYNWGPLPGTEDQLNLTNAVYLVLVTDANGCSDTNAFTVGWQSDIISSVAGLDPRCFGEGNGEIDLSVTNGLAPYRYSWSVGDTTQDLSGLDGGMYVVTITDVLGCTQLDSIFLVEPDSMWGTVVAPTFPSGHHISENGKSDGSIDLTVGGGYPPYTYLWSPGGETTEDMNNVPAGPYTVTVYDENGCTVQILTILTEPLNLMFPSGMTPNGDGSNDAFVIKGLEAYADNTLLIFSRWGNQVYSEEGYQGDWIGTNYDGKPLPEGTYFYMLTIEGRDETFKGYIDLRR